MQEILTYQIELCKQELGLMLVMSFNADGWLMWCMYALHAMAVFSDLASVIKLKWNSVQQN